MVNVCNEWMRYRLPPWLESGPSGTSVWLPQWSCWCADVWVAPSVRVPLRVSQGYHFSVNKQNRLKSNHTNRDQSLHRGYDAVLTETEIKLNRCKPLIAYVHCRTRIQIRTQIPNPMATWYYAEHVSTDSDSDLDPFPIVFV